MILHWHSLGGTWTACDRPPPLVQGIALIRAAQPNICLFGQGGLLNLQAGADRFSLTDGSPRIRCSRGILTLGLRRRFSVESSGGSVLFSHSYWTSGDDFFRWLAARVNDQAWRAKNGPRWSNGVDPAELRSS